MLDTLLTDKEDWNRSGRWQRLSREWVKNHKQNASLLLRGKELKRAEGWLKRAESWQLEGSYKKPLPDDLQIQFIHASRRVKNRFWLTSILAVLLLIGSTGGGLFLFLYHNPTLVTTQQDGPVGSLRWAVANAPSNSTITFASNLTGDMIVLTSDLVIPGSKHLTLKYAGSGKLRISLARNTLLVNAGASLTLFNISLLGGASNPNALLTNYGTLTLIESTVSGNTSSGQGGGGILNNGTMTLTNSTVSGNTAFDFGGGGIYNNSGTLTLMNSTVSGNTALATSGGGIYNSGTLTLMNCTISGNAASDNGGGILNDGTMKLTNSTISGNTTSQSGGGILNDGTVSLTFCTLYGNQATDGGGLTTQDNDGFGSPSIPIYSTIQNSLIAGKCAPQHPDIAGKLTSKGYNLIQNRAGATFIPTTGDQFVLDLSRVFASNVHLENNGGPTQTLALLTDPANPARGAIPLGSCQIKEIYNAHARMYIDQRGMVRPGNKKTACDIGAYETQM